MIISPSYNINAATFGLFQAVHIVIVNNTIIPALYYGGTERVIWYLGKELVKLGHRVTYLVNKGSECPFANVIAIDHSKMLHEQLPPDADIVHFQFTPPDVHLLLKPYLITIHGNTADPNLRFDVNTVFVSRNHAARHGSDCFVYNGLDWDDYPKPEMNTRRTHFHFLGKAAWRVKNVKGAIEAVLRIPNEQLMVLGGKRYNFSMGVRLTFSKRIQFFPQVSNAQKATLLQSSKGLVFPVRWHEPFGLAIIESLYYGCPVFGTPYGSLPELIPANMGYLSASSKELSEALVNVASYNPVDCHLYAQEHFSAIRMAAAYLEKYIKVLNHQRLNPQAPKLLTAPPKFLDWNG